MVRGKKNFLARDKNDQLLREITTLYMPNADARGGVFKLESTGHVVVKPRKKSSQVKRTKLRNMLAGHGKKDAYLETVRILSGRKAVP